MVYDVLDHDGGKVYVTYKPPSDPKDHWQRGGRAHWWGGVMVKEVNGGLRLFDAEWGIGDDAANSYYDFQYKGNFSRMDEGSHAFHFPPNEALGLPRMVATMEGCHEDDLATEITWGQPIDEMKGWDAYVKQDDEKEKRQEEDLIRQYNIVMERRKKKAGGT